MKYLLPLEYFFLFFFVKTIQSPNGYFLRDTWFNRGTKTLENDVNTLSLMFTSYLRENLLLIFFPRTNFKWNDWERASFVSK
jgi:hypothetical protein